MKLIFNLFSLAVMTTVFFSCSSDGGEDNKGPKVAVTFMAEGAEFHYYNSSFFGEDTIKTIVEKQIGKDTFLIRNYSDNITVFPTQYWVLKNGNFYSSFRLRDPDAYYIECKFGKPEGTSWDVKRGAINYTYSIEELDVTILTGQGEVTDAVKVKIKGGGSTFYQYVSPTVGLIGNGDFEDADASMYLCKYFLEAPETTTRVVPAITYGNFAFLKVGNFWTYQQSSLAGDDELTITVERKLSGKNIFEVSTVYESGDESMSYWFEDNGYLMVYEDGEDIIEADPIYIRENLVAIGQGWSGFTSTNKFFIYEIQSLNEVVEDEFFGDISCMGVEVTDGLFSFQTNYWNANKGQVAVSGFISMQVTNSNARQREQGFVPVVGPWY